MTRSRRSFEATRMSGRRWRAAFIRGCAAALCARRDPCGLRPPGIDVAAARPDARASDPWFGHASHERDLRRARVASPRHNVANMPQKAPDGRVLMEHVGDEAIE